MQEPFEATRSEVEQRVQVVAVPTQAEQVESQAGQSVSNRFEKPLSHTFTSPVGHRTTDGEEISF